MAKFQLLSCDIALGGDILNVVARHAHIPVTYPELLTLQFIHGENAITNVFLVGHTERDEGAEMARLQETYGAGLIREKMFPGAGMRLPLGDDRYRPRVEGTKANPGIPDLPDETGLFEGRVPREPGVDVQDTAGTTPASRTSRLPGPDADPERVHDRDPPAAPTPSTRSGRAPGRAVPVNQDPA